MVHLLRTLRRTLAVRAARGGLLLLPMALSVAACSDTGDTTALGSPSADATEDVFEPDVATGRDATGQMGQQDSTVAADGGSLDSTVAETPETGSSPEATPNDTGVAETSPPPAEGGVKEAGAPEASVETGAPEGGTEESGAPESGTQDSESPDTGAADGGTTDTGTPDTGGHDAEADAAAMDAGADTGSHDAEADSTLSDGAADAGPADAGSTEAEAGSTGLVPCTTAGQTGCVQCWGNTSNLCTPTQAVLVQLDITKGTATAPGQDPTAGCYSCLVNADCINDDVSGDTNHECDDLAGNFGGDGGGAGQSSSTLCLATLSCIVTSACANTNDGESFCYCGSGGGGPSACASAGSATNGACKSAITDGLYPNPNDSTDVLKDFTDTTQPSGMADQVIHCAVSNHCTQCLQ